MPKHNSWEHSWQPEHNSWGHSWQPEHSSWGHSSWGSKKDAVLSMFDMFSHIF